MKPPFIKDIEPWFIEIEDAMILRVKMAGWAIVQHQHGIITFEDHSHGRPLRVIASGQTEADGKRWIHVSASHMGNRLPSWESMKRVKDLFIGQDKKAIQIFAPTDEHYSHWEVLHLWHCIDGDGLPDFRVTLPDGSKVV